LLQVNERLSLLFKRRKKRCDGGGGGWWRADKGVFVLVSVDHAEADAVAQNSNQYIYCRYAVKGN
jgi:hypothetical protein